LTNQFPRLMHAYTWSTILYTWVYLYITLWSGMDLIPLNLAFLLVGIILFNELEYTIYTIFRGAFTYFWILLNDLIIFNIRTYNFICRYSVYN
jgi:hypothetical protein